MAEGAWVPCFDSIWGHSKTAKLARALNMANDLAAAKMLRLWSYARDHATSGDIAGIEPEVIARAVGLIVPSDRAAERRAKGDRFLTALREADFVEGDRMHLSGWEDGPGKLVERRQRDRDRQADRRETERRAREEKARSVMAEQDRQRRIDEAREAGRQRGSDAVTVRSGRGGDAVPMRKPAATPPAPASAPAAGISAETAPSVHVTEAESPADEGGLSVGTERTERDTPLPPTGAGTTGRRTTKLTPIGKPDCGRCRDPFFVHASVSNDRGPSYAGDCAACARRGTSCTGYTSEVMDPDIPDETSSREAGTA